ncbi:bifunctional 6-phosphofructo-2-kinase/fructose-2,6-bisphosphate 2-phosphatase [Pseudovirgaria hyperparasitica]|uniref:Bifunctional 6-phosphofructo-2-kinase/fructose-2,6-bisphosphate 2-phosphatase n=1 Tax=Pseudovirgaria hyperparasitica TaxID=470096 RepID=A0A6A6W254_9PEZI|nr:bifunctional 6-phosphofructo-2-kinase/fructose-2,6-bisphosphate 2-phosphatase [Pseudovirgaria hyperparasitica]KAF2755667.1 bifunctional 6-phosphofructo-2-kinase/fructose-2,6-bisphosphate 2-phosphatase [Pseudovirgaria hyperparasitica]
MPFLKPEPVEVTLLPPRLNNNPQQHTSRSYTTSKHSAVAKSVLMSKLLTPTSAPFITESEVPAQPHASYDSTVAQPVRPVSHSSPALLPDSKPSRPLPYKPVRQQSYNIAPLGIKDGVGAALTDTPMISIPPSPKLSALKTGSGASTPRIRPTTLDIPGLTKSKVSPDGKISQRDIGSKLVIVMVGLPARGKSYITKKITRYLNWQQHNTRIFNVGERRRIAASGGSFSRSASSVPMSIPNVNVPMDDVHRAATILVNGVAMAEQMETLSLPSPAHDPDNPLAYVTSQVIADDSQNDSMDQSANFFDPGNSKAAAIREQAAKDTLDELLEYIFNEGSVGIFDATNSTLARRKWVMQYIRDRAGPELNVLFLESLCLDENLLESNMRLKLSGPDYQGKDPVAALADFKQRVAMYEKTYVPLGEYEEKNNMPYVQMIDVGRKVISHQINGFLSSQTVYYLLNFNLAPRMIWITRHGQSMDNVRGKIGGDAELSKNGHRYSKAMARFIEAKRAEWEIRQEDKIAHTHFPPHPGDHTPPNPHYCPTEHRDQPKNFCVWTSMLKRSIESGQYFEENDFYEVKQMRMLNELYAGEMEGMTYEQIREDHKAEFELRVQDKMAYRYPGPGGEGYLDVINRLRPVIVELERMTDHALLITHRSVARVLLAYFKNLPRDNVADLDCPLGMLYMLEPKPYGVEFHAFRYNSETDWFDDLPEYELHRTTTMQQFAQ